MQPCLKTSRACLFAFLTAIFGSFLCLTPYGLYLEEEFGLNWLFNMRGTITVPDNVLIVSLDKASAEKLKLPENPEKWPRSLYARLINNLSQKNAAVIAFGIIFDEPHDSTNDKALADSMRQSRNVILSNYLKRSTVTLEGQLGQTFVDQLIQPISLLANAALTAAPFPLPRTSSTVNQFWAYKTSAGDIPTFPVIVFQNYAIKQIQSEILQLLNQTKTSLKPRSDEKIISSFKQIQSSNLIARINKFITNQPNMLTQMNSALPKLTLTKEKRRLLQTWFALLQGEVSFYFNHYGPVRTIPTYSFYDVLSDDARLPERLFNNKIVLIGYSENIQPEKNPGFYTVFSKSQGDVVSPIEIAATAVANLVDNAWIRPMQLGHQFLFTFFWGCLLAALYRCLSFRYATLLLLILSIGFVFLAYAMFTIRYLWLPLFIPIALQMPLILLLTAISCFITSARERQTMEKAFSYYLPSDVVSQITTKKQQLDNYGEMKFGVCMATDAEKYTTLSESMTPMQLGELMNQYYALMFKPVKRHGGFISDVIGDAMLAIWAAPNKEVLTRLNACKAALEVKTAVDQFNLSQVNPLPTRIGLHDGVMRLGNVGALDHLEYRAVGDIVNTATRIEGINKLLKTTILASATTVEGMDSLVFRNIGAFLLKGKSNPIEICELIGVTENIEPQQLNLVIQFEKAVDLFKRHQWSKSLAAFTKIYASYPGDGPTLFYINYLKHLSLSGLQNESTAIIQIGNTSELLQLKT